MRGALIVAMSVAAFAGEAGAVELFPASGGMDVVLSDGQIVEFFIDETPQAEIEKTAIKLWGEPEESGRMEECGAGPIDYLRFDMGLSLHFQDGMLIGWFIGEDSAITTRDGLGAGSTVAEIEAIEPDLELVETTLGMEFWTSNLFGVVTGNTSQDTVVALWSGTACIFR